MTFPMIKIEWEPLHDGIFLILQGAGINIPMTSVRELRDDMTDAAILSRGREREEVLAKEVEPRDMLLMAGMECMISSTLAEEHDKSVLQWLDNAGVEQELIINDDQLITVYREVE